MDKAYSPGAMDVVMKENTSMIRKKDGDALYGQMDENMSDTGRMANSMVKDNTLIRKAQHAMGSGRMDNEFSGLRSPPLLRIEALHFQYKNQYYFLL